MQSGQTNLLLRNDTILGVCEAIGQDFGFNPNWLRIAFAAPIYWNPMLVIGTYLALGVVVMVARYAFPDRQVAAPQAAEPTRLVSELAVPREERELAAA